MGIFDTVLDVASLGLHVANAAHISQLQQANDVGAALALQGAQRAAMQQQARNILFAMRAAADDAAILLQTDPRLAAGKLRLMQFAVAGAGLTPALFDSLPDKEYAKAFHRSLEYNIKVALSRMSPADTQAFANLSQSLVDADDADFYLKHVDRVQAYIEAKKIDVPGKTVKKGLGPVQIILIIFGLMWGAIIFSLEGVRHIGLMIILGAIALFALGLYLDKKRAPIRAAREVIKKFDEELGAQVFEEFSQREAKLMQRGYYDKSGVESLRDSANGFSSAYLHEPPALGQRP